MEIKVKEYELPQKVDFNFEELKTELEARVSSYETAVYSDMEIKKAKADKADLNRFKKALNDERIRREKEYMQPFNDFKSKVNEIIAIIDKPIAVIDAQVKAYEEKQKKAKAGEIEFYFNGIDGKPEFLELNQIMDSKWLNASVSMNQVKEDMNLKIDMIKIDIDTIRNLPEFAFEAEETYKSTLSINTAIGEAHRLSEMAKKKAEQAEEAERLKAETELAEIMNIPAKEPVEIPVKETAEEPVTESEWINFSLYLNGKQLDGILEYLGINGISYKVNM